MHIGNITASFLVIFSIKWRRDAYTALARVQPPWQLQQQAGTVQLSVRYFKLGNLLRKRKGNNFEHIGTDDSKNVFVRFMFDSWTPITACAESAGLAAVQAYCHLDDNALIGCFSTDPNMYNVHWSPRR